MIFLNSIVFMKNKGWFENQKNIHKQNIKKICNKNDKSNVLEHVK